MVGGTETLVRRLAGALRERRWAIEVWTTTALDESTWAHAVPAGVGLEDGVTVRRFRTIGRRRPRAFHQLSRLFFRLPAGLRPERVWLRAQGPHAPGLIRALATAPSIPTLFTPYLYHPTVTGIRVTRGTRLMIPAAHDEPALRLRMVGAAIAAGDALLYNSLEERELVERIHPAARRLPAEVGTVGVPAGPAADVEAFRMAHRIGGPYLLCGGRSATGKGLELLLQGFARLRELRPDAILVLAGDAGLPPGAAGGVIRVGRLTSESWWSAVAGAAAVVAPGALESLSLVALEAWAAGRPCLLNAASPVLLGQSQRAGGALTYVDPPGFAAAADRLLGNRRLGDRLGAAGRAHVDAAYSWDGVERRLLSLIEAGSGRRR